MKCKWASQCCSNNNESYAHSFGQTCHSEMHVSLEQKWQESSQFLLCWNDFEKPSGITGFRVGFIEFLIYADHRRPT